MVKEAEMSYWKLLSIAIAAYLLGSIPTALIYSRITHGEDIRALGDGNMGARNTKRTFGWKAGVLVALIDILKGAFAVWLAMLFSLPGVWNYICGALAVMGHDFPVFARFKGGQGFAATVGIFLGLFPMLTIIGAVLYGIIYFATRSSDVAAGIGMGFIAGARALTGGSVYSVAFIVLILLFVPLKKWMDKPRRVAIGREHSHSA